MRKRGSSIFLRRKFLCIKSRCVASASTSITGAEVLFNKKTLTFLPLVLESLSDGAIELCLKCKEVVAVGGDVDGKLK
jgi:hypothetical protein